MKWVTTFKNSRPVCQSVMIRYRIGRRKDTTTVRKLCISTGEISRKRKEVRTICRRLEHFAEFPRNENCDIVQKPAIATSDCYEGT